MAKPLWIRLSAVVLVVNRDLSIRRAHEIRRRALVLSGL
jgi:hypothetical protein